MASSSKRFSSGSPTENQLYAEVGTFLTTTSFWLDTTFSFLTTYSTLSFRSFVSLVGSDGIFTPLQWI